MFKPSLLCSSISLALAVGSQPLLAQGQGDSPELSEDMLEEIVVTGLRGSVSQAIEIKRESMAIVDSVVAEDIGKLPDNNVIESLQRLSGIQVTDRGAGEVSAISIRGLTDISTTINGRVAFTASGRSVALADVPSTLVKRIDVRKSRSAEHFENGIAGQVDIRTFRPLDFDGARVSLSARGIYQEEPEEFDPNLSALFSNRWDTQWGDFGALVNVSFAETNFQDQVASSGAQVPFMTAENPAPGFGPLERIFNDDPRVMESPIWQPGLEEGLPTEPGSTLDINGDPTPFFLSRDAQFANSLVGERKRPAANISLQWAPNERSTYTLESFYNGFRNKTDNSLNFTFVDWWGNLGPNPSETFELIEGSNVIGSRTVGAPFTFTSGDFSKQKTTTFLHALAADWDFTDKLNVKAEVFAQDSYFESRFIALQAEAVRHQVTSDFTGLASFEFADNPDTPDVDESDLTDASQFAVGPTFDNGNRLEGEALTFKVDADYDLDWQFIRTIELGFRYEDRDSTEYERDGGSRRCLEACTFADFGEGIVGGTSGFFSEADVPSAWFSADGAFMNENLDMIRAMVGRDAQIPLLRTFDINEENTTVYGTVSFDQELWGNTRIDGEYGLRFVDVENTMDFGSEQADGVTSASNSNDELLNSLMARFHFTDNLLLRAGFSQTLRMPNFTDLNPNITFVDDVTQIGFGTGSGGNPDLAPTTSDNTDISLEWYFGPSSNLAISWFERDIEDLVVIFRNEVRREIPDFNANRFIVDQPDNASTAKLDGVEFSLNYFPQFLPGYLDGLGVLGSATFLDSEQTNPVTDIEGNVVGERTTDMFGVSDVSYNVTLAYQRPTFDARLSYTWREEWLNNNIAASFANPLGLHRDDEQNLDLQLNYFPNDSWVFTFAATNLTEEILESSFGGNNRLHSADTFKFSRTFSAGVRYNFGN